MHVSRTRPASRTSFNPRSLTWKGLSWTRASRSSTVTACKASYVLWKTRSCPRRESTLKQLQMCWYELYHAYAHAQAELLVATTSECDLSKSFWLRVSRVKNCTASVRPYHFSLGFCTGASSLGSFTCCLRTLATCKRTPAGQAERIPSAEGATKG